MADWKIDHKFYEYLDDGETRCTITAGPGGRNWRWVISQPGNPKIVGPIWESRAQAKFNGHLALLNLVHPSLSYTDRLQIAKE